jgi:hypothetical protein
MNLMLCGKTDCPTNYTYKDTAFRNRNVQLLKGSFDIEHNERTANDRT